MKKILSLLLALALALLLSACGVMPTQTTPATTQSVETTAPTEVPTVEATEPETEGSADPYVGVSKEAFYANYTRASSYQDAQYRSKHGLMSGSIDVPGQYFDRASYQPTSGGSYLHNSKNSYADNGNTYIIVDGNGNEVMRIYRGGAYITLEEVAAYMYAFGGSGDMPANYSSKKSAKPANSMWGIYLRVNHSRYSNNTSNYPYEPRLPGDMQYYEMDIGTTGTSTPGYSAKEYNNGYSITRGAARLVYARRDLNGNGTYEQGEVYVFYTHNHYNDFTEYLNYYGGWGETFGNITGGGTFDSKSDCNPTPYVECIWKKF